MATNARNELEQLPPELLEEILDYILTPSDLAACMLTCKLFNRLAMPRLYHILRVDCSYESASTLGSIGGYDKPGMKYVKEVYLSPSPSWYEDWNSCCFLQSGFIRALGEAPLEKLVWQSYDPRFVSLSHKLWKTLENVRNLDFFESSGTESIVQHQLPLDRYQEMVAEARIPSSVKEVRLVPKTAEYLYNRCAKIQHLPLVTALDFDARYYVGSRNIRADADMGLDEMSLAWITRALILPQQNTYSGLTRLRLANVDLSHADRHCFKHLALDNLKDLTLEQCLGMSHFLTEYCLRGPVPLESLQIIADFENEDGDSQDRTVTDINMLLMQLLPGSLQNLVLRLHRVPESPMTKAINRHRKTLQTLTVDVSWFSPRRRGCPFSWEV